MSEPQEPGEFVQSASAVGGALAGTTATLFAGPFVGSAAGELTARVLLHVGTEVQKRLLAPRQEKRIAEAYASASKGVEAHLVNGDRLRDDFYDPSEDGGTAGEFLEGVLLTAADAWEQRKVPYIGRLFAEVSFESSVNVADANYLLRLADQLTYRQLLLLAFWHRIASLELHEQVALIMDDDTPARLDKATDALQAEMEDLNTLRLVGVERKDGTMGSPDPTWNGIADVGTLKRASLIDIHLTSLGEMLHRLMALEDIPTDETDEIIPELRGPNPAIKERPPRPSQRRSHTLLDLLATQETATIWREGPGFSDNAAGVFT